MRYLFFLVVLAFAFNSNADDFEISFDWSDLELCTTGNPNIVSNPYFELTNVPNGTKWIEFKLTDLDVPSYNHGGGWMEYKGQNTIEPGIFKYKSPCPPNGKHNYQWTAFAKEKKGAFGKTISKASASKFYP